VCGANRGDGLNDYIPSMKKTHKECVCLKHEELACRTTLSKLDHKTRPVQPSDKHKHGSQMWAILLLRH